MESIINSLGQYKGLVVVGLTGYIVANIKNIWNMIYELLVKKFSYSITVTDDYRTLYEATCNVIQELNPNLLKRHRKLKVDREFEFINNKDGDFMEKISFLNNGTYNFYCKYGIINMKVNSQIISNIASRLRMGPLVERCEQEKITICMFGNFKRVLDLIRDEHARLFNINENVKCIMYNYYLVQRTEDQKLKDVYKRKRYFDTIYNKKCVEEIKSAIDTWYSNKDIFIKNGINNKLGILLVGPPGTGKTSIINAIATYTKASIVVDYKTYMDDIVQNRLNDTAILALEDFDTYKFTTNQLDNDEVSTEDGEKLGELLNILDSSKTRDNMIIVATTNADISKLDQRIFRPGRFDYIIEVGNIGKEDVIDMCNGFNVDPKSILNDIELPIQPALLQSIILNKMKSGVK